MITKYFTEGLQSLKEGMTVFTCVYDDEGELLAGIPEPFKRFKVKEITEEEYNNYLRQFEDPNIPKGVLGGIINEKGIADLKKFCEEEEAKTLREKELQISLSVKKIKKMLTLGIIEESDIDNEITQQGLSKFREEIKKRVFE